MTFASKDLSVLAYANGFTLWHYVTTDAATVVDTTGYFTAAAGMLRTGDMILANTGSGAGVYVAASSGGVVDVSNLTPFGAADDD